MVNRQNYKWVQAFKLHLAEVIQLNALTVGRYGAYLKHLLLWSDELLLSRTKGKRPTFPAYLTGVHDGEGDQPLAPTTVKKILQTSQRFFRWARLTYPQEFQALPEAWIDTLRPPRMVQPIAEHNFVTLDEVTALTNLAIDSADLALRRDQAAAALLYLSGMRVGALGSLPISAVDLAQGTIKQWPSLGVHTKNSKTATTYLLPIPELLTVVTAWDAFIRARLPATAMWYTPIISQWGEFTLSVEAAGASRNAAVGKRLRLLYAAAGLPFKSAHKFRHGHAVWALQHAPTMADYKAVSQNLMHGDIRITDGIYAPLLGSEVQHRIANLSGGSTGPQGPESEQPPSLQGVSRRELAEALRKVLKELDDG